MSAWDSYPSDYRSREVHRILQAVQGGECVAVVGLSGAGKSNLLGYIAHRLAGRETRVEFALVDCNRLQQVGRDGLFQLMRQVLGDVDPADDEFERLHGLIKRRLDSGSGSLCLLLDRFDLLNDPPDHLTLNNLRVLRDLHKYRLTYVTATRRPLDSHSELAELFFAHTLWLGPLSESDARWNVARYAARLGKTWDEATTKALIEASWGYPALLRAVCEAHAGGCGLTVEELSAHPTVQRRVREFWQDEPDEDHLQASGLAGQPLLMATRPAVWDTSRLTAKEKRLLDYLRAHSGEVCEKDELIRAVWPEDRIYEEGVRDDSLAQVVRRLRVKIETDPSNPRHIRTVPGRGYLFKSD